MDYRVDKLLSEIKKARDNLLTRDAEEYFAEFKGVKDWYDESISTYQVFVIQLQIVLDSYKRDVITFLMQNKKIFVENVEGSIEKTDKEEMHKLYTKLVLEDTRKGITKSTQHLLARLQKLYDKYIKKGFIDNYFKPLVGKKRKKYSNFTSEFLDNKIINWAKQVGETTEKEIKKVLVDGFEKGASIDDLTEDIRGATAFSSNRAQIIARTEVMQSGNYIDYTNYMLTEDIIGFYWQTCLDDRVRKTHNAAHNQYRVKGESFNIGGYKMRYPGDQLFGAPAKELIQCRCWLKPVYEVEKKSKKEEVRTWVKALIK